MLQEAVTQFDFGFITNSRTHIEREREKWRNEESQREWESSIRGPGAVHKTSLLHGPCGTCAVLCTHTHIHIHIRTGRVASWLGFWGRAQIGCCNIIKVE